MKIYDYADKELFVVGGIHGNFTKLLNAVKQRIQNEHDTADIIKKGMLPTLQQSLKGSVIVVSGDCGFGLTPEESYLPLFDKTEEFLNENDITLLFMRGNNDDPSYFSDEKINFAHIKAIPDYSVIITRNHSTLCIGGAVSIDRSWRIEHETRVNSFAENEKIKIFWPDETMVFNETEMALIEANDELKINSIITHTNTIENIEGGDRIEDICGDWVKEDEHLLSDMATESKTIKALQKWFKKHRIPIKWWAFSHFNTYSVVKKSDTLFLCYENNFGINSIEDSISMLDKQDKKLRFSKLSKPYFEMPDPMRFVMPEYHVREEGENAEHENMVMYEPDAMDVPALEF